MLFRPISCAVALLALGLPASAGELRQGPKAVLELFTSQGCASCPQADALLDEMGNRPDVVTLAYHVDYWDYIGWQDTFGAKENSKRQRDYAAAWGSSRIFTPQLVVNGESGVVGSKRDKVDAALATAALPLEVKLTEAGGDTLDIDIAAGNDNAAAVVWLVTFRDRAEVEIDRGENEGKTIAYTHIVTGRQVLGLWDAGKGASLSLPLDDVLTGGADGAAILVQQDKDGLPGPILGAASFTR
ncbi:MAG: DUF1223 domain-containing protein [Devosia sp.]